MKILSQIQIKQAHSLALFLISASVLFIPQQSEAVPAFSRQTGMACASCHFQNFPALNSFGRTFRAQGYTMRGQQKMIEGDDLSLPSTLNASVITKIRYQQKSNADGDRGEIQWPDEAALLIGGRASEHIGFLMELGLGPQEGTGKSSRNPGDTNNDGIEDPGETWTENVETETTGNYLSTKFHFNPTDNFAIVTFSTDGLGVGYGFELMNTGAQRSQRPIENRKGFSAGQMLGTASGEATGMAFVYHTNNLFVNYSHWTPEWGNSNANIMGGMANYLRVAYMPHIGGWDTGFGFSHMSGSVKTGATDPATEIFVDSWTVDAQAQGQIGSLPFGLYASYGVTPKSTAMEENHYNSSMTDDLTALGMVAKLGIIPGKTQVYTGYGSKDSGASGSVNTTTIGIQHNLAQNIKLELYDVKSDSDKPGDDYTMLMFFAGF